MGEGDKGAAARLYHIPLASIALAAFSRKGSHHIAKLTSAILQTSTPIHQRDDYVQRAQESSSNADSRLLGCREDSRRCWTPAGSEIELFDGTVNRLTLESGRASEPS